jgi:hypothetical protein
MRRIAADSLSEREPVVVVERGVLDAFGRDGALNCWNFIANASTVGQRSPVRPARLGEQRACRKSKTEASAARLRRAARLTAHST